MMMVMVMGGLVVVLCGQWLRLWRWRWGCCWWRDVVVVVVVVVCLNQRYDKL